MSTDHYCCCSCCSRCEGVLTCGLGFRGVAGFGGGGVCSVVDSASGGVVAGFMR